MLNPGSQEEELHSTNATLERDQCLTLDASARIMEGRRAQERSGGKISAAVEDWERWGRLSLFGVTIA